MSKADLLHLLHHIIIACSLPLSKAGADDRADSIYFPHATILLLFYPFLFKISHNALTANFFCLQLHFFRKKKKPVFSENRLFRKLRHLFHDAGQRSAFMLLSKG
ncbi:hypothetical protein BBJ33_15895 [Bacillus velezensis]|nr:hypothetical protein BBJ33_15895 [Bacillus velezensis]